jgi:glyoxylase-like metal-dependent hydrolase (beta-lactamase superfamily II)
MSRTRLLSSVLTLIVFVVIAWLGSRSHGDRKPDSAWKEISPGIFRSSGYPAGHALVVGKRALLIDAPELIGNPHLPGVEQVDHVLLTHHHRDSVAAAKDYLAEGFPVRAPKLSAPWLTADGVRKYWKESLPLRNSRTAYLVLAEGLDRIDCSLDADTVINWEGWTVKAIPTPGHTIDHLAFSAQRGDKGELHVFCGDAMASPGKIWSPYTTDWDHWTNIGLKPAAESLRKLAALKPDVLFPAHGEVITRDAVVALTKTAEAVEEMSFLKSFERYTKERLKNEPQYRFLVKEQAQSNGSKPWSRISDHLWLTGNTYVLTSKDNAYLVVDPWDPHSAKQIPKLKEDQKLGTLEVVWFSHAHYDHYDGIYSLMMRDNPKVWTLDHVAVPLVDPMKLRAPFLDSRPIRFDRLFKDGETTTWREYTFKFHYLPGQTDFTMGVETTIDGKRCFFTADNWFHQDQFSGSGGWMGLNRSHPLLYEASARKVLGVKPEWVLAEHGGAFEFNAEDFRRRAEWGKVSAKAADALCVSGSLLHDWDPHRIRVEPVLHRVKPGATLNARLIVHNPLKEKRTLTVTLEGRGQVAEKRWKIDLQGGETRKEIRVELPEKLESGRHVFTLRAVEGNHVESADTFIAVDVE